MRFWKDQQISKGLLPILLILFVTILSATTYFTYTMLNFNTRIRQGDENVHAAFALQGLILNLRQAESGQRSYIITNDERYLQPYHEAVQAIPGDLSTIQSLRRLSKHTDKVRQLNILTNQRLSLLADGLAAHQQEGFEAAKIIVASHQGSQLMDRIRILTTQIGDASYGSVGPTQAQSKESLRRPIIVAVMLDCFVLAMCGVIISYFHKAIVKERSVEGAKNEFLSLASHQLRTPATSVKQYLGMMDAGYFGELSQQQKEALQIAYKSNETGIAVINNLLNIAKLNLNKIQLSKEPVVLADIIREVVTEHRATLAEGNQTIKFINTMKQQKAHLDATYFKTILENLIDNAGKYSGKGTVITLRLAKSKVSSHMFELTVRDTGVGIKRSDLGKIFTKFSRLPNTDSGNAEGSGLGLYWVKRIIELHGGQISVKSKVRQGTIFTIEMPL